MTTCMGKSCSFGLPRVSFVNCCHFMYLVVSLLVLRARCGIWLYQFLIIAYLFTLYILYVLILHVFYVYWHKQETSALHLCLLIPNACRHFIQMFCFNNVDHSAMAMVCVKTEIHSKNISANDNAASTSTQISKVTQSISRVFFMF